MVKKISFFPLSSDFGVLPHGNIARMDQNYPLNVGTCAGFTLQLLARNLFFQSDRPEPPSP